MARRASSTSATSSGWPGSSIHGVSRLFSWWFPRYDASRFDVSLCGLKSPGAGLAQPGGAGHPGAPPRPRPLRPAHPDRPRAPWPASGGRASSTSTATPPPISDAWPRGAWAPRSSCTSTSPTRACRPTRRWPIACSPPSPIAPSRSASPRATSWCASATSRPSACGSSGTARPSTSSRPCPPSRRAPRAARSGLPGGRAGGRHASAGSTSRRATATCWRPLPRVLAARARARLLIVGDGDLAARCASRPARWASRTGSCSPATATTCPRCSAPSTSSASPRPTKGTPLALFEAMAAGKAIVSTAVDGCREVLEDGVTGAARARPRIRRALAGALGAVLADPACARRWRARRASASRRYDIRTCVAPMQALYDEVLRGEARRPRERAALGSRQATRGPGRSRAICCCGATRPSSPAARCPRARARLRLPQPRARELRPQAPTTWPTTATCTLSRRRVPRRPGRARRAARSGPCC